MKSNIPTTPSAVEDLKMIKNYIVGVLGFGTAVTAFLTQVLHFPLEPTLAGTTLGGALFLVIVYLIYRAERRMELMLSDHIDESNTVYGGFKQDMDYLKKMALETQRSSLRTEMDNEMFRNPANHDTIIRYAYRYFDELDSDWVETEKFIAWMDREKEAGREVHLPKGLMSNINKKIALESTD